MVDVTFEASFCLLQIYYEYLKLNKIFEFPAIAAIQYWQHNKTTKLMMANLKNFVENSSLKFIEKFREIENIEYASYTNHPKTSQWYFLDMVMDHFYTLSVRPIIFQCFMFIFIVKWIEEHRYV